MNKSLSILESAIFDKLEKLCIKYENFRHESVLTIKDSKNLIDNIPVDLCKSLFLKDKKKNYWLLITAKEESINLNQLAKDQKIPRLSFCKPTEMKEILKVEPGSVTPFALIYESAKKVKVIFDKTLQNTKQISFHPLHNKATTTIKTSDFFLFIDSQKILYIVCELPTK
ncbi:prolyl-tRNA synthetase associated domain-containing protein [Alphaproteobacteria bacterium]|nr:prolyl-tRNA synthetase associated domain-containing protein [Alphaproteobacteria bacterium]